MHLPTTLLTTALLANLAYSSDSSLTFYSQWYNSLCNVALNNIEGCSIKGPRDRYIGTIQDGRCVNGSWTFKDHGQCEGNTFSWYWENNFPHFTYTKKSGEKVSLAGVTNLAINATNTVTPVSYTPSPTPSYFPELTFGNANLDGDCVVNLNNFKGCSDWKMGPIGEVLHGKCHSDSHGSTGSHISWDCSATLFWSWDGERPDLTWYDHGSHENYTIGGITDLKIGAINKIYVASSASVSVSSTPLATPTSTATPSATMVPGGGPRGPFRGGPGPEVPPSGGFVGPKV
ncbi:hypothetical protein N7474_005597 [Penicillium riverlandense]|uniref:uncharacterized protein n=1 Tax=Penicillium riverlandense TaxID=1903569 RepID=UPI0025472194|nr:uncharacterized protein N7474_005597 [Penicillium riverlandense]KAJ5820006.1 hypothetical protein N7474_005597 [Penicillium riverlandense]